jgi:hypothetical protein
MAAELDALGERYPAIPEDAKDFTQIAKLKPSVPHKVLREEIHKLVVSGKWKRGRRKNVVYYWPA